MTPTHPLSCFGIFDIRAVVGDSFNASTYTLLGAAFAQWLNENLPSRNEPYWVGVGYDARLHSPELSDALVESLRNSGIGVIHLGLCPTPAVYFAEHASQNHPSVPPMVATLTVTASHNPAPYNGLKFTFQRQIFNQQHIARLKEIAAVLLESASPTSTVPTPAPLQQWDVLPAYVDYPVAQTEPVKTPLRIVTDAGNATGGLVAPELFRRLGCEVIELFSEPDGRFPNHHPDPCRHKNLKSLIHTVQEQRADFGLAFDGDSDRLGVVDNTGRILTGDILVLLFAEALLGGWPKESKPPVVVAEVKCTQTLFNRIQALGGEPVMAPTGHIFIKEIMKERHAVLGGELSGHFFFKDRYFGFDDAFYAALRFLELVRDHKQAHPSFQSAQLTDHLPQTILSEEQRIPCPKPRMSEAMTYLEKTLVSEVQAAGLTIRERITIDGLRLTLDGGFLLIRPSNTEPCLTLRYEVADEPARQTMEQLLEKVLADHSAMVTEAIGKV